jgi:hypothetical protein
MIGRSASGFTLYWLIALFLFLFPGANAEVPPSPVPAHFAFAVDKANNKLEKDISIEAEREYYFALQFSYSGERDLYRILNLVGTGAMYSDGRYAKPGVIVPLRVVITPLKEGSTGAPVVDKTVDVQGSYRHGFTAVKFSGNYNRMIVPVVLKPGTYRVQLQTIKELPEFSGIPSYLNIGFHPKASPSV